MRMDFGTTLVRLGSSVSPMRLVGSFRLFWVRRSQIVHPCPSLLRCRCQFDVVLDVMRVAWTAAHEFDVEMPCIECPSHLVAAW